MTEYNIIESCEKRFDSTVNATLLGVLGSNINSESGSLATINTRFDLTSSQKAALLIERFRNEKKFIQEIISGNITNEENRFFVGKSIFFLRDIQDAKTGKSQLGNGRELYPLTDNSLLIFESGNTPFIKQYSLTNTSPHTEYVISINMQTKYGIVMKLSNSKFQKSFRHLNEHVSRGMYNLLYVFGQLIELSTEFYSIIPFAIW